MKSVVYVKPEIEYRKQNKKLSRILIYLHYFIKHDLSLRIILYLLPPLVENFRTDRELAKINASLSFWSFDTKAAKFATPVTLSIHQFKQP